MTHALEPDQARSRPHLDPAVESLPSPEPEDDNNRQDPPADEPEDKAEDVKGPPDPFTGHDGADSSYLDRA